MKKLKVFLVDDEQLALNRLERLLIETEKVEIIGQTTDSLEALDIIPTLQLDAIFLDIQMPELSGFELLQILGHYPPVVFTTAFDKFALKAFEVFSVDYLLKPVESERLETAVRKLIQFNFKRAGDAIANIEKLLENLMKDAAVPSRQSISRIASRIGGKIQFFETDEITHFFAEDKMTFAQNIEGKRFPVDLSLNELETKLDSQTFLRIHRGTIINVASIDEVHGWFSGKVFIRLNDKMRTELIVARDRVRTLKELIGM